MEKELAQLEEFHKKFNCTWHDTPTLVDDTTRELRARLMREEVEEVVEAMEEGDIEHIAKEISDLLYAVYGTIGSYGLAEKMPAVFSEVHTSNISKDAGDRNDTKAVKGVGYREADVSSILNN